MSWLYISHLLLCFLPLPYFSWADWRTQSIPALPLEVWCVINCLYAPFHHWQLLLAAMVIMLGLTLLTWSTHGLGSADILVIGAITTCLGLRNVLTMILLACLLGLMLALYRGERRIPFVPVLSLSGITVLGAIVAGYHFPWIGPYTLVLLW